MNTVLVVKGEQKKRAQGEPYGLVLMVPTSPRSLGFSVGGRSWIGLVHVGAALPASPVRTRWHSRHWYKYIALPLGLNPVMPLSSIFTKLITSALYEVVSLKEMYAIEARERNGVEGRAKVSS